MIYRFLYELKHAFVQIRHHFMLCLSSVSAIFISMILVSVFVVIGLHIESFSKNIESDVRIHVVLNGDVIEQAQIDEVQTQLEQIKNVKSVIFSSKDEELELMIAEKGNSFELYRGEENPLANAFFVFVKDGTKIEDTSKKIKAIEGVADCAYGGSSVVELMNLLGKIRYVGYGAVALLLLLSLYLIYNTIRTTIYSQQDEIAIMTTVGATRRFVRVPYEIQGIVIGLTASLLTYLLVKFGYEQVYNLTGGTILIKVLKLIKPAELLQTMTVLIFGTGTLLGWLASFMAVSKYVKQSR